ncbi:MAG TPA: hypothetical protein VFY06_01090 [Verrucomicrobiae bacterium]|nr:hypothetical protein [Verrucomicrobiae bacterium]
MKPKLLLCLALVLTILFVCEAQPVLRVVIIPSTNNIRILEPFGLALRVENPTRTNQTIRVMSCSWYEEWQSSSTNITWIRWICTRNFATDVSIPAGGAYTNELKMLIPKPIPEKKLSFRMGFTSIGSARTLWSNEIKLHILPPSK